MVAEILSSFTKRETQCCHRHYTLLHFGVTFSMFFVIFAPSTKCSHFLTYGTDTNIERDLRKYSSSASPMMIRSSRTKVKATKNLTSSLSSSVVRRSVWCWSCKARLDPPLSAAADGVEDDDVDGDSGLLFVAGCHSCGCGCCCCECAG